MNNGSKFQPYYAVIFTSIQKENVEGYKEMATHLDSLVAKQPGYLGMESVKGTIGITVSYWKDLESIKAWRENLDHIEAINKGKNQWYKSFNVRIAKVEREYEFIKE